MRTFSLQFPHLLPSRSSPPELLPTPSSRKRRPPSAEPSPPASQIRLEFSEGVEPRFSGVTLTSAGGGSVPLGRAKTEPGNASILVIPIGKPLSPGVYTVRWHAVSVDTHHTQGDFQFTVKP